HCSAFHLYLHSFPTRRSSDLQIEAEAQIDPVDKQALEEVKIAETVQQDQKELEAAEKLEEDLNSGTESTEESTKTKKEELKPSQDRKSTRLNSSHVKISYAVF